MIKFKLIYQCSIAEKFFIEKSLELLHAQTIDSYRLRIHNPLTIMKELTHVIIALKKGELKNISYVVSLIEETRFIISQENELTFNSISKKFYLDILKRFSKEDFDKILYSSNLIIKENENNYASIIFDKIVTEISRLNQSQNLIVEDLKVLNGIIGFFYIELINRGYSKQYLDTFIRRIFFGPAHGTINNRIQILNTLIARPQEEFKVVIGLTSTTQSFHSINILNSEFRVIRKQQQKRIISETNEEIKGFFSKYKDSCLFYETEVKSQDYYSSIKIVRSKLQLVFDSIHMGHSEAKLKSISECAGIGMNNPTKGSILKLKYYIDGFYKSEPRLYQIFLEKLDELKTLNIQTRSLSKIYSGLRYLRLGAESSEIENKLLNYWIGLEYIFSSNLADEFTLGRIRGYFKKCHANIYFKRNLKNLHEDILKFELNTLIPEFNNDLMYLTKVENYDLIISRFEEFPLLVYRTYSFKEQLLDHKKIDGTLEKHQKNLDWNLNRIYRLRNEVVHNASMNNNIESVTSHIRYYLVFILNALLDYFLHTPIDIDSNSKIEIDDYFILQEIQFDNLKNDPNYLSFEYLISVHNPIEYLL